MKILLLGEYSNVHATLAEGLRNIGHEVTVVSNGDFWKNYPRDIDLSRREGKIGGCLYMLRLYSILHRLREYDIVQLINPMFLELKAERIFPIYRYLRRHNKHVVMGAFGMDYYWVDTCCRKMPLRYSDFNIGKKLRNNADALKERKEWLGTAKENLNRLIAEDCDAIVTGLYEYWVCYHPVFEKKTVFIPFPIKCGKVGGKQDNSLASIKIEDETKNDNEHKLQLFIGINKTRSEYKGTDIMLKAAKAIEQKYPEKVNLRIAESVPFAEYRKMMDGSDAILDQLYSYTPSMNPLEAMSKGIICIGGGEPENYAILHEDSLRPIVNVTPSYESVYDALEELVMHPEKISKLQNDSVAYVRKHHDYIKVAREYEELYKKIMKQ